jgi:hypothetical protein
VRLAERLSSSWSEWHNIFCVGVATFLHYAST